MYKYDTMSADTVDDEEGGRQGQGRRERVKHERGEQGRGAGEGRARLGRAGSRRGERERNWGRGRQMPPMSALYHPCQTCTLCDHREGRDFGFEKQRYL